ncbi:MAG: prephenate dehydratase domain-containing protein, partial [Pseudomonadota bacterium]
MAADRPNAPVAAYQGAPGAHSHMAAVEARPGFETLACPTFDDVFAAVE